MAEQEQNPTHVVSTVEGLRKAVNAILEPITRDGTIAAFLRQGADEMAVGLKAFPESISVEEPGSLLNPTQGEIAADRKPKPLSPSEIARSKHPYTPEHTQDDDHKRGRGR
jgi:hypothetical protein